MKSKREGNTRFRLVLTLGLAVVLPALTLIYVNFKHVKSIQRDKKVEGTDPSRLSIPAFDRSEEDQREGL